MEEPDIEDWSRVGVALTARVQALAVTKAELLRASGLSQTTLDGYLAGAPRTKYRADKVRDLCIAVGWTSDSIERILQGEEPVLGTEGWRAGFEQKFNELRQQAIEATAREPRGPRMNAFEAMRDSEIESLRTRVADLERRLAAMERQRHEFPISLDGASPTSDLPEGAA